MISIDNPYVIIMQPPLPNGEINFVIANAEKEPEKFLVEEFDTADLAEEATILDLVKNLKRGSQSVKLFSVKLDDPNLPFEFNRSLVAIAMDSRRAPGNLVIGKRSMIDLIENSRYTNIKHVTFEENNFIPDNMLLIAFKQQMDFPIIYLTDTKKRYMLPGYLKYFSLLDCR